MGQIEMSEGKQLKIAMLGHKRIPSREGGIEVVVEELATRMAKKGHSVTCYNRKGHHVSGKEFDTECLSKYEGVTLKNVFTIERKGLAAVSSSVFASICAALGDYDIVHYHAEGPCAMLWLPKLFGKRCIATIHGIDWKREKWAHSFGRKYIKFGEKVAVKYADEIIVLSDGVQDYFDQAYKRETKMIPNGVDRPPHRSADAIKARWGLDKDNYLLFLGRIVPEKGLRNLIQAFREVQSNKRLVIAGGASDTDVFFQELRELAAGDDRILFTGFVQGRMLEELYSNAYLYVLPSDLEGMPLSLLEAMSYGNCCVVSDISECTEVVEDHAIVCRRGDVRALAKALQACCDNIELVTRYKSDAADFICGKYDWDEIVDKTLNVYLNQERTVANRG